MAWSYESSVIGAPAEDVWKLVRRFDGLADWHPGILACAMVEGDDPRAVGARRRQVLAGGHVVHARLVSLDDQARSITYEMLDGHFPVREYFSTIRVIPVTLTGDSFVEWWGRYDADKNHEESLRIAFGRDVYRAGLRALAEAFRIPVRPHDEDLTPIAPLA